MIAFLLAGIVYSFVQPAEPRFPDERDYLALGSHIIQGRGYSLDGANPTAVRPPGYPYFVAAASAFGGGLVRVRIVQFFLVAGTILLAARLASESPRPPRLLIVTALMMAYPISFYMAGTLYPQTLASFLFMLALTLLLTPKQSLWLNAATGAAFGALILVVPTFAFTFIVAAIMAWALGFLHRSNLLAIAFFIGLTILPWTARNYLEFHQLVPLASNSGANLLLGNSENAVPDGAVGVVDWSHYGDEADARGLDELGRDRFFRDAALAWIGHNPGRAFLLYLEKSANFFNFVNQYDPHNAGEISLWKQAVNGASYLFLLSLLAWRLRELKTVPLTRLEIFLLVVYGLSAFTTAIFLTRIRFRVPYDYLIITIVAMHLARKWEAWRAARAMPA